MKKIRYLIGAMALCALPPKLTSTIQRRPKANAQPARNPEPYTLQSQPKFDVIFKPGYKRFGIAEITQNNENHWKNYQ